MRENHNQNQYVAKRQQWPAPFHRLVIVGRQRFGDPEMSFEDVARNFAEQNVFEMPPAGRVGMPHELAMVACLLASPLSGATEVS